MKVKNALRPMPGATAKGSRAYRPISSVIAARNSTVAVSAPVNGMPVPGVDRIAGVHDDDVGHREEGGDAADYVGIQ